MPAIPQQTVPTPAPVTPRPVLAAAPGGMSTYVDPRIAAANAPLSTVPAFNFPLPMVAVVGDSGSGKTYSYGTVDWDKTALIDTEQKGFSFDRAKVAKIKYYFPCKTHLEVEEAVKRIQNNKDGIRYMIIDSMYMYMEMVLNYTKAAYPGDGFKIYGVYNETVRKFIKGLKNSNVVPICVCVPELVTITDEAGKNTSARRIATFGRELEGKLELEFLVVLYTTTKTATNGDVTYHFITNRDGICSAKSPPEIFKGAKLVANDLGAALKLIDPPTTGTATAA